MGRIRLLLEGERFSLLGWAVIGLYMLEAAAVCGGVSSEAAIQVQACPTFKKSEHFAPQVSGQKHGWGMATCDLHGCMDAAHTFDQLVSASVSCCQALPFKTTSPRRFF